MGYVDEVLEVVKKKNADQPEFLQAVTEVLDSLRPVIDANEELYRKNAILERIIVRALADLRDKQRMAHKNYDFLDSLIVKVCDANSPSIKDH